jgi:hypothetical protein
MGVPYRLRMLVPPELRVLSTHLRPALRAQYRDLASQLVVPPSLRDAPRRAGSVWGVAMMRDEIDTAGHVVRHMLDQGIDQIVVSDNGSVDGTTEVLRSLSQDHPVHVVHDPVELYAQSTKMTILARLASKAGADWVVPFDADELWFARGASVADFLRSCDDAIVRAEIHNVFPSNADDASESDVFRRLGAIDRTPFPIRKVAFRTSRLFKVGEGNMDVSRRGTRRDGLFIAHYPWRSYEQLVGKLRRGRKALEGVDSSLGVHWREAGGWSDERLGEAWQALLAGEPVHDLSWSPVGDLVAESPGTWNTWQLP